MEREACEQQGNQSEDFFFFAVCLLKLELHAWG